MSTRINTNVLSLNALNNIYTHQAALDQAVNRLSSGLRINNAWDDPAGLAVSERFRGQIASMQESERNANSDINLMATAEGALGTLDAALIRMRALAIQASNGALSNTDRAALDVEYQQLKSEVDRIARITNYAGVNLLDGTFSSNGLKFHIGVNNTANQDYYYVNIASMTASDLGIGASVLTDTANSQAALALIDAAVTSKDFERSRIGSYVERLQQTISALQVSNENATKSESEIRDADIAAEMSNFVRAQLLMQTGVSMLAQANAVPQIIAQLVG